MSGGRGLVIPSLSRNKEAGRVKVIISFIRIIISLIKVKEEVKTVWEIMSVFTRSF